MTRDEMVKIKWTPYMAISYQDAGMKLPADCMLSGIDFDSETLILTPINEFYEQREFVANLKYCSIPKKLKIASVNGNSVAEPKENYIKNRKIPL